MSNKVKNGAKMYKLRLINRGLLLAAKVITKQIGEEQASRNLADYSEGFVKAFDGIKAAIAKAESK